jgi:F0F1-type ATP synthase assembly protein I
MFAKFEIKIFYFELHPKVIFTIISIITVFWIIQKILSLRVDFPKVSNINIVYPTK